MLDAIDVNGKYEYDHGLAVIIGFVKQYVVWRRPGCAANVCTLNDFAKRFRRAVLNAQLQPRAECREAAWSESAASACSAVRRQKGNR